MKLKAIVIAVIVAFVAFFYGISSIGTNINYNNATKVMSNQETTEEYVVLRINRLESSEYGTISYRDIGLSNSVVPLYQDGKKLYYYNDKKDTIYSYTLGDKTSLSFYLHIEYLLHRIIGLNEKYFCTYESVEKGSGLSSKHYTRINLYNYYGDLIDQRDYAESYQTCIKNRYHTAFADYYFVEEGVYSNERGLDSLWDTSLDPGFCDVHYMNNFKVKETKWLRVDSNGTSYMCVEYTTKFWSKLVCRNYMVIYKKDFRKPTKYLCTIYDDNVLTIHGVTSYPKAA